MAVVPSSLDLCITVRANSLGSPSRFLDTTGGLTRDVLRAICSQDTLLSGHCRSSEFCERLDLRSTLSVGGSWYTEDLGGRLLPIMVGGGASDSG